MSFDQAFSDVVDIEKSFSDDPRDPGNWTGGKVNVGQLNGTMLGISAAAYPNVDIKNLTPPKAKALYLQDYWDKAKCDTLPDQVACALFKQAVNMGVSGAIKAFQISLGEQVIDGIVGQITVGYASRIPAAEVIENFLTQCAKEYIGMSGFAVEGVGWMRRLIKIGLQADVAPK
jgi:lysozyme family protein